MQASKNVIVDLTFKFSLDIIAYTDQLEQIRKYAVANQLLRSGTSIGANVREAQAAQSRRDFVHKLKISEKEMEETEYWLALCKHSSTLLDPGKLESDLGNIKLVLRKILGTCYRNGYGK
jgi:four helix bundle protein